MPDDAEIDAVPAQPAQPVARAPRPVIFIAHVATPLLSGAILLSLLLPFLFLFSFKTVWGVDLSLVLYALILLYTTGEIFFAASPGKAIFGTTIRGVSGTPASRLQLFLRWAIKFSPLLIVGLGAVVEVLASAMSPGVSIITSSQVEDVLSAFGMTAIGCFAIVAAGVLLALGRSGQTLHDRMTGTAVFERAILPASASLGPPGFDIHPVPVLPVSTVLPSDASTAPAEARAE